MVRDDSRSAEAGWGLAAGRGIPFGTLRVGWMAVGCAIAADANAASPALRASLPARLIFILFIVKTVHHEIAYRLIFVINKLLRRQRGNVFGRIKHMQQVA